MRREEALGHAPSIGANVSREATQRLQARIVKTKKKNKRNKVTLCNISSHARLAVRLLRRETSDRNLGKKTPKIDQETWSNT